MRGNYHRSSMIIALTNKVIPNAIPSHLRESSNTNKIQNSHLNQWIKQIVFKRTCVGVMDQRQLLVRPKLAVRARETKQLRTKRVAAGHRSAS